MEIPKRHKTQDKNSFNIDLLFKRANTSQTTKSLMTLVLNNSIPSNEARSRLISCKNSIEEELMIKNSYHQRTIRNPYSETIQKFNTPEIPSKCSPNFYRDFGYGPRSSSTSSTVCSINDYTVDSHNSECSRPPTPPLIITDSFKILNTRRFKTSISHKSFQTHSKTQAHLPRNKYLEPKHNPSDPIHTHVPDHKHNHLSGHQSSVQPVALGLNCSSNVPIQNIEIKNKLPDVKNRLSYSNIELERYNMSQNIKDKGTLSKAARRNINKESLVNCVNKKNYTPNLELRSCNETSNKVKGELFNKKGDSMPSNINKINNDYKFTVENASSTPQKVDTICNSSHPRTFAFPVWMRSPHPEQIPLPIINHAIPYNLISPFHNDNSFVSKIVHPIHVEVA